MELIAEVRFWRQQANRRDTCRACMQAPAVWVKKIRCSSHWSPAPPAGRSMDLSLPEESAGRAHGVAERSTRTSKSTQVTALKL
jgi:hypothetical protein